MNNSEHTVFEENLIINNIRKNDMQIYSNKNSLLKSIEILKSEILGGIHFMQAIETNLNYSNIDTFIEKDISKFFGEVKNNIDELIGNSSIKRYKYIASIMNEGNYISDIESTKNNYIFSNNLYTELNAYKNKFIVSIKEIFENNMSKRDDHLDERIKSAIDSLEKTLNLLIDKKINISLSNSQYEAYKDCGVNRYKLIVTFDEKTSKICSDGIDGKIYLVCEFEIGITAPPFHPYCRTITVPVYDMDNYKESKTPIEKFINYSLDETNDRGKNKAYVYKKVLGFTKNNAELLVKQIINNVNRGLVSPYKVTTTKYGKVFRLKVPVNGANNIKRKVICVYQIDNGETNPRMITNYVEK